MTQKELSEIVEEQISYCMRLWKVKDEEYAIDGTSDSLSQFKKAAILQNVTPEQALYGMLSKHLISIADMCPKASSYSQGRWTEKITDTINYMLLLKALVKEREQLADQ